MKVTAAMWLAVKRLDVYGPQLERELLDWLERYLPEPRPRESAETALHLGQVRGHIVPRTRDGVTRLTITNEAQARLEKARAKRDAERRRRAAA